MDRIATTLDGIRRWLAEHAPGLSGLLNPAATPAVIAALERELGLELPPAVRAAYLQHDGEAADSQGIFGTWVWLPLRELRRRHLELRGCDPARLPGLDIPNFLPLLESGGGDMRYALAGAADGPLGEYDARRGPVGTAFAGGLAEYLETFLRRLHAGDYLYLPDDLLGLCEREDCERSAG